MTKRESKKGNAKLVKLAWLSCVESVIIMIRRLDSNQPIKRNNAQLLLTTATGAALGAGARFVVPTKNEMSSFRTAADTFFSNAQTSARGANRSILKYAGIGAAVAALVHTVTKLFAKNNAPKNGDSFEYSKYQALIDAPEYATEILIYGD